MSLSARSPEVKQPLQSPNNQSSASPQALKKYINPTLKDLSPPKDPLGNRLQKKSNIVELVYEKDVDRVKYDRLKDRLDSCRQELENHNKKMDDLLNEESKLKNKSRRPNQSFDDKANNDETQPLNTQSEDTNSMQLVDINDKKNIEKNNIDMKNKERNEILAELKKLKNDKMLQNILAFRKAITEEILNHENALKDEEYISPDAPGLLNKFKRTYRTIKNNLVPTAITVADLSGTVGFVTNIYINVLRLTALLSRTTLIFFGVVASPLALAALGSVFLFDTYNVWKDNQIKQRKTRYVSNFMSIALLSVAFAIILGVLAAPGFAIPLVFLGFSGVGYAREHYIISQTEKELESERKSLEWLKIELENTINETINSDEFCNVIAYKNNTDIKQKVTKAFNSYRKLEKDALSSDKELSTIKKDYTDKKSALDKESKLLSDKLMSKSKIEYLTIQINDKSKNIKNLELSLVHMQQNQQVRKIFLISVGFLLSGAVFTLLPPLAPLAAFFTLVGAALILSAVLYGTYIRYKQNTEKSKINRTDLTEKEYNDEDREIISQQLINTLKVNDVLAPRDKQRQVDNLMSTPSIGRFLTEHPTLAPSPSTPNTQQPTAGTISIPVFGSPKPNKPNTAGGNQSLHSQFLLSPMRGQQAIKQAQVAATDSPRQSSRS